MANLIRRKPVDHIITVERASDVFHQGRKIIGYMQENREFRILVRLGPTDFGFKRITQLGRSSPPVDFRSDSALSAIDCAVLTGLDVYVFAGMDDIVEKLQSLAEVRPCLEDGDA